MARGYPGAFGRHVNALYIWLPLCVLFILPFFDFRRPFSMLHLDLLVLLSFSVSLAFFNHANIYASVPLAYPPLLYLLARMLALLRRRAAGRSPGSAAAARARSLAGDRRRVPARLPRRAERHRRQRHRRRLRRRDRRAADRRRPAALRVLPDRQRTRRHLRARATTRPTCPSSRSSAGAAPGTTSRPPTRPRSSSTCSPSALLFLIGRRMRGPTLGVALAYAWVAVPVHAVRAGEQLQRHARRRADPRGAARGDLPHEPLRQPLAARSRRSPASPSSRRSRSPRCWPRTACARPRRCSRSRARRATRSRFAVRLPAVRGARPRPRAPPRLPAHDLRAHDRLPGRPRARRSRSGASTAGSAASRLGVEVLAVLLAVAARA